MPELSILTRMIPAIMAVIVLVAFILPQATRILVEYERGAFFVSVSCSGPTGRG